MSDIAQPTEAPSKFTRNYTLGVLVLIYASSHIDRQIVSILAESIKQDLLLSDTQLGFLIGLSFALFYATLGIPIAILADRYSRRNIIAAAVIIWSGMTALSGLAANFTQLALARIGVGIGEAGSSPPSHSMITDMFPLESRGAAMGIYAAGINLGILVGFLVGGFIDEWYGWRMAFFIVGIPGIFLGLLLLTTVREPARTQPPRPLSRNYLSEISQTFLLMMSIRSLRHIVIGCTLVVFVGYGTTYWNGVYFRRIHGLSPAEAGTLLALIGGIIGGIGTFTGGWLADKLARRDKRFYVWLTAGVKLLLAPFVAWFYLTTDIVVARWLLAILAFFGGFYLSVSFAMTQSLLPATRRALGAAILLFCINILGLGLGPLLVGMMSDAFSPTYGQQSLRYALLLVSFLNIWGSIHYYLAGHTLAADLEAANSR
ncbi:MAG: MFS transporter [PS1 clade bacterium]|nr:MFS transporter [PS1 clade bacterium]CAI8418637.1 MAG: putative L-galactonate transporter [Rhodobiaceae bacterium UBA7378]|tara:strand:+ start:2190 stop:3479 length:1290 start_codon:yes stop_codon:yes gene_type:complete